MIWYDLPLTLTNFQQEVQRELQTAEVGADGTDVAAEATGPLEKAARDGAIKNSKRYSRLIKRILTLLIG